MKKNFHPKQQNINIIFSDGRTFIIPYTLLKHKENSVLLELDIYNHPLWNNNNNVELVETNIRLTKFKRRFNLLTPYKINN